MGLIGVIGGPFRGRRQKSAFDRQRNRWMFTVDWNRKVCLECLDCVKSCPNKALSEYQGRPIHSSLAACTGCMICRTGCQTKAVFVEWVSEEGFSRDTPTLKHHIEALAHGGKPMVAGMGARRKTATLDNLVFLPGQLFQPPLDEHDEVDTAVVLGKKAAKPVKLAVPILIGAMSFGALSKEAKIALARATAKAGSMANSGEGGMLEEERAEARHYTLQYSTGRFGINGHTLAKADMVEIKIGQGAKPGLGGHLLKEKLTEEIARTRGVPMGQDVISPSKHPDINSKEDLKAKVAWLREMTGGAPVGIKLAGGHVEKDLEIALFAGVDVIAVDGMEGGTGAAPLIAREHAALPLVYVLSRAARYLESAGARDKVTLIAGGGLRTAADFAKAFALGAEAVYISSSALVAMGCQRCRACHTGRCPAALCTHSATTKLDVEAAATGVANFIAASVEEIKTLCRMVGKRSISQLSISDMAALDLETARITQAPPA